MRGRAPPPLAFHSSDIIGRRLYIFGGVGVSGHTQSSLYILCLDQQRWLKVRERGVDIESKRDGVVHCVSVCVNVRKRA